MSEAKKKRRGKRNPYGAKGVTKAGNRYRVQFFDENKRCRTFGTFFDLAEAVATAKRVQAHHEATGEWLKIPDQRMNSTAARSDSETGVKGVQRVGKRFRVRLTRPGGGVEDVGMFATKAEAQAASMRAQVQRLRKLRESATSEAGDRRSAGPAEGGDAAPRRAERPGGPKGAEGRERS